jgi:Holliday junction DNA helicase RuvB
MTLERIISGKALSEDEQLFNLTLRPRKLAEYIGQGDLVEKLNISLTAARQRGEPLEHVLLHGPPGLGKTTLAHIIAREMKSRLITSSGPALVRPADLMGILTNLERGDVLFIDEIHRVQSAVEEFLYPAMEDFRVDFVVDKGMYAKTINVPLKPFTLVGATTRAGLLSAPLRDRFGISHHLDFYSKQDISEIIRRSAKLLEVDMDDQAVHILAERSRGTPRTANRVLRRVRDYAEVKAQGRITSEVADKALLVEGVDKAGLDELDRKFLRVIIEFYQGGPVGIEAIAATLNEEVDTLVDMVEPFLLKIGFVQRTRKGRKITQKALKHLDMQIPTKPQQPLFENTG